MINLLNFFGTLAFFSTIIGLFPQVYKSYKTKSTKDISCVFLLNYVCGSFFWCIYAWLDSSFYVLYSNLAGFTCSIYLIYLKYKYEK